MKIAVCDDDQQDLDLVCSLVRQYDNHFDLTAFTSAGALMDSFQTVFFDLVFLDIEMESPNGFEVAETLMAQAEKPLVVFVTNSSEYMLRGYGIAFRYLTKPITYESVKTVLDSALEQIIPQKIVLSPKEQTILLSIQDIYYIEIKNHTVMVRTKIGQFEQRGRLKDMEAQLPSAFFSKPHNSYIVNLAEVSSIEAKRLTLTNGDNIPISQRNRKPFELALFQYVRR